MMTSDGVVRLREIVFVLVWGVPLVLGARLDGCVDCSKEGCC